MTTILFTDPKFLDHDPGPGHVETPARLDAIMGELGRAPIEGLIIETPRPATDAEIEAVHLPGYRGRLAGLAGEYASLDPDTAVSPGSWDAAWPAVPRTRSCWPGRPVTTRAPARRWGSAC
jgi:acetoin utilization deacetylase AcuC-like enzyme